MNIEKLARHSHILKQRIYYEDTDFSGAVYHAAYLKFFERGRTDWLRSLGIHQKELFDKGFAFVVSKITVNFIATVKMDDEVNIHTNVARITSARIIFNQEVRKTTKLISKAEVNVSAITLGVKNKPMRLTKVI